MARPRQETSALEAAAAKCKGHRRAQAGLQPTVCCHPRPTGAGRSWPRRSQPWACCPKDGTSMSPQSGAPAPWRHTGQWAPERTELPTGGLTRAFCADRTSPSHASVALAFQMLSVSSHWTRKKVCLFQTHVNWAFPTFTREPAIRGHATCRTASHALPPSVLEQLPQPRMAGAGFRQESFQTQ